MEKKDRDYKKPTPREFVPTELGSAVFASIKGRPADEDYLITDKNSGDEKADDTGSFEEDNS